MFRRWYNKYPWIKQYHIIFLKPQVYRQAKSLEESRQIKENVFHNYLQTACFILFFLATLMLQYSEKWSLGLITTTLRVVVSSLYFWICTTPLCPTPLVFLLLPSCSWRLSSFKGRSLRKSPNTYAINYAIMSALCRNYIILCWLHACLSPQTCSDMFCVCNLKTKGTLDIHIDQFGCFSVVMWCKWASK